MSRIGKKPISIPESVTISVVGSMVTVNGPKGELTLTLHPLVTTKQDEKQLVVTRSDESKLAKSVHGLTRSLLSNMVTGVVSGYQKRLELVGTGYRVAKKGQGLSLNLGFSHSVDVIPPGGVTFDVDGNSAITVSGVDKQAVGQVAANIRAIRPPEPYKGKGVRYANEHVRRKAGKQAKVGAA